MLFFYNHRQSSDIESNEVWEPVSKKPHTEGHDDNNYKSRYDENTIIRIRRALLQVYTHKKEFVLMTGASSAEESTDIVQTYMIVQTYI